MSQTIFTQKLLSGSSQKILDIFRVRIATSLQNPKIISLDPETIRHSKADSIMREMPEGNVGGLRNFDRADHNRHGNRNPESEAGFRKSFMLGKTDQDRVWLGSRMDIISWSWRFWIQTQSAIQRPIRL